MPPFLPLALRTLSLVSVSVGWKTYSREPLTKAFFVVNGILVAAVLIATYIKIRTWNNRPRRQCVRCGTIAQPIEDVNQGWSCSHCGASISVSG